MATDESSTLAGNKPRGDKEKSSRQRGQKKEKAKPLTKIVIRNLPPTMTEEEFLKQIDPLPDHDFYYFVSADWSLGYDATCRAYITLRLYDDVFLFRDRFDGYVFVDVYGAEYPAIVEFAPFQGMAKNKSRRSDNKVNTIEQEPHYLQFLEKLEQDREAAMKGGEKLEFTLDRKKEEKITSTPLLQYLANKKEKRREEAKKRSEEKRRQAQQQQQQQKVTKIISNQEEVGSTIVGGVKKRDAKAASSSAKDETGEETKPSRLKRRAERNQRRREAHEQRILDRDRERKEKGGTSGEAEQSDGSKTDLKQPERQQQHQRKSDESKQRKESKKSSDRERDRNRNRKDKEKLKLKEATSSSTLVNVDLSSERDSKTAKDGEINDTVMSFIRAVATTNESESNVNDPEDVLDQHEESNAAKDIVSKTRHFTESSNGDGGSSDVKESKSVMSQSGTKSRHDSGGATMTEDEQQRQKQRAADEQRRIRNKDRPSIAIYQPKIRQRQSEERDVTADHKDVRSNPTSDCESVKKEENSFKKVSRYSERRSEKRATANRDKVKCGDVSSTQMHELPNSLSMKPASEAAKRTNKNSET